MRTTASILLIDDEPEIADLLCGYLGREGLRVDRAATAREGWEAFQRRRPDLVLLDLMLPDGDGLDLCRQIRDAGPVPVVILSAKDSKADLVLGLGLGADDYVAKPFDVHEVVARVKAQLRRVSLSGPGTGTPSRLTFPGLTVDKEARTVTTGRGPVELTAKEFDLLALLADHPGRVFTKDQIVDRVWGPETWLDGNTLSVHVSRLRRKIEADPETPRFIVTVWNLGYKFGDRNRD